MVVQLQLHFELLGQNYKFLSDDSFFQIRNTLEHIMKQRASVGFGTDKRKAEINTYTEENKMWEIGV